MTVGSDPIGGSRLKLIVIDDHQRAREALVRRLEVHPLACISGHTEDILEAHQIVAVHRPHVALVDPRREDGLGARVVASLAALPASHRPLIVLHVAYFNPEDWAQARSAGADDLVLKRIGVDALVSNLLATVRISLPPDRWPNLLHS